MSVLLCDMPLPRSRALRALKAATSVAVAAEAALKAATSVTTRGQLLPVPAGVPVQVATSRRSNHTSSGGSLAEPSELINHVYPQSGHYALMAHPGANAGLS